MLQFLILFVLWAMLHSVTATDPFKKAVRRRLGERTYAGLYRLLYNLASVITLLPVLYALVVYVPQDIVWAVPPPYLYAMIFVQLIGVAGLTISLLQTDVWSFTGLRQAAAYLRGDTPPPEDKRLVTGGLYRLVRHPLYLFSLLILWFIPVMTAQTFTFNLMATSYFWVGSIYEERRLARRFGDDYRRYQERVPRILPLPRKEWFR